MNDIRESDIPVEIINNGFDLLARTCDGKIRKLYLAGRQFSYYYIRYKNKKYQVNFSENFKTGYFCLDYPI